MSPYTTQSSVFMKSDLLLKLEFLNTPARWFHLELMLTPDRKILIHNSLYLFRCCRVSINVSCSLFIVSKSTFSVVHVSEPCEIDAYHKLLSIISPRNKRSISIKQQQQTVKANTCCLDCSNSSSRVCRNLVASSSCYKIINLRAFRLKASVI